MSDVCHEYILLKFHIRQSAIYIILCYFELEFPLKLCYAFATVIDNLTHLYIPPLLCIAHSMLQKCYCDCYGHYTSHVQTRAPQL
jgi:hypothetical protein